MTVLDRRFHAFRPDLADERLRGRVEAERFVAGVPMRLRAASAPLRREPRPDAALDTEALFGEAVEVFEQTEGWAWGRLAADGYVGYLPAEALGAPIGPATHRIAVLRTFAYSGASMKLPPLAALPLGAQVRVIDTQGTFSVIEEVDGIARAHVWSAHLCELAAYAADPVAEAERFLGVPYLWGGRTGLGLDCSALVQVALAASGRPAPRDSDRQEAELGEALPPGTATRRGDLIFWKGHVGLMQDETRLLHASGHHMLVVSEPLEEAIARIIAKGGGPVTAMRRIAGT